MIEGELEALIVKLNRLAKSQISDKEFNSKIKDYVKNDNYCQKIMLIRGYSFDAQKEFGIIKNAYETGDVNSLDLSVKKSLELMQDITLIDSGLIFQNRIIMPFSVQNLNIKVLSSVGRYLLFSKGDADISVELNNTSTLGTFSNEDKNIMLSPKFSLAPDIYEEIHHALQHVNYNHAGIEYYKKMEWCTYLLVSLIFPECLERKIALDSYDEFGIKDLITNVPKTKYNLKDIIELENNQENNI
ncbi:Uncharacterised protein [Candidatus Tiddalikarchaeum anstoanum]|nr:Uncharacterised protein [Candidatus Tiddalikarchaeum anstoanum]